MNAAEVIKLYTAGIRDFSVLECDDFNLDNADLSGADLSGANFSCISMLHANLSDANLINSDLSDCDLTGANLNRANLSSANLSSSDLISASLIGVNMKRANLEFADLTGSQFSEANLCDTNLYYAKLNASNLENADLRGANLEDVRYDETTKFPIDIHPKSYKGLWIDSNTFMKYVWIDYIEIAKNWDRFHDLMIDMGLGKAASRILRSTYGEHYNYGRHIKRKGINIAVSDLDNLDWDYIRITDKQHNKTFESSLSLHNIEDAVEEGDVELIIFLYT